MNFLVQLISELRPEPKTPGPVLILLQQFLQGIWQAHSASSEKVCRWRTQLCPGLGEGLFVPLPPRAMVGTDAA